METMTIEQVCEVLKIKTQSGRNRTSKGKPMPPSFRVGRRRLYLVDVFECWLKECAAMEFPELDIEAAQKSMQRGRPRKSLKKGVK